MFEVGVVAQFEAAHRLQGDFGPATRTHGHTYRVEASVRGPRLRDDGTLCDIVVVQGALQAAIAALHYRDLDELPAFAGRNTTAETVAKHLYDAIAPHLAGRGLASLAVRVWESPNAWAACEGTLDEPTGA
jgi:6-pyruvoyltetrahydropterin/6-carboxytetrahydropterin synthase